jgi:hypothetical protein
VFKLAGIYAGKSIAGFGDQGNFRPINGICREFAAMPRAVFGFPGNSSGIFGGIYCRGKRRSIFNRRGKVIGKVK